MTVPASPFGRRAASFLVPPLVAVILLYQAFASLQIALAEPGTIVVALTLLALAAAAGTLAAFGGERVRIVMLGASVVLLLETTLHFPLLFDRLAPAARDAAARDDRRVADLHRLQAAIEDYIRDVGPLRLPVEYGEGHGPQDFWEGWWDLSSRDGDGDGVPFLDFLVERAVLPIVPVDPFNQSPHDQDPRAGSQYVFFVAPPNYRYEGGSCVAAAGRSAYLLAITDLELEPVRPPNRHSGSGCECLWRDQPNFFQKYFDYVLCGTFEP